MTRMRRRCSRERGRKFFNRATRRALELILHLLLIHNFAGTGGAAGQIAECPPPETIPGCPCYNFDDGLFLECAGATEDTLRSTLLSVLSVSGECTPLEDSSILEFHSPEKLFRYPIQFSMRRRRRVWNARDRYHNRDNNVPLTLSFVGSISV